MNRRSKRNIAILRSQERSPRCLAYRLPQPRVIELPPVSPLLAQENALTAQPFKPLV